MYLILQLSRVLRVVQISDKYHFVLLVGFIRLHYLPIDWALRTPDDKLRTMIMSELLKLT